MSVEAPGRWPNLFLLGVAKAGTTSLASFLGQHPDLFMSPVKEPHYFSRVQPAPHLRFVYSAVSDERDYLALFRGASGQRWVGEASTSYFWDGAALDRIDRVSPHARHLVILRHPVERAYSHFLNLVREGIEKRSFAEAVADELAIAERPQHWGVDSLYLDTGLYSHRLDRAFGVFGRERLLVLVFEEMLATPRQHLGRIFRFLGVDAGPADTIRLEVHNRYARPRSSLARDLLGSALARRLGRVLVPVGVRPRLRRLLLKEDRKPPMAPDIRRRLARYYRTDIQACEGILDRRLPWELDGPGREAG